jgi:hypothetical protein
LGDVRIKHAAANNKNGVVGITGKKIPITPNTTLNPPMKSSKAFIALFLNRVIADIRASNQSVIIHIYVHYSLILQ